MVMVSESWFACIVFIKQVRSIWVIMYAYVA